MITPSDQLERGTSIKDPARFRDVINRGLRRAFRVLTPGPGIHIDETEDGVTISSVAPLPRFIWPAKVDSRVKDGSNNRWVYQVSEVYKATAGYGGWAAMTGGRSGTAYNMVEDQNGSTGTYGNGVVQSHLDSVNGSTGTHAIQPIPVGTRVWVHTVIVAGGAVEFWIIGMPNGVTGTC